MRFFSIYSEDILECIVCEEPLEDRIQFPCLHVTCFKCAHQWLVKDGKETCLVCQARVPVEFKIKEHKKKKYDFLFCFKLPSKAIKIFPQCETSC